MSHINTLILGIGNILLSDEGAGIHALNRLQTLTTDTPNLTFVDGGTLSFTLTTYLEECDRLIVFDAVELHQPAGTVEVFVDEAMDDFLGRSKRSAHEVGLLDLMDMVRLTGHLPEQRALIGIQPEFLDWGMEPTKPVQQSLPHATDEALRLLECWPQQAPLEMTS